jgi:hypothetical protein
VGLGACRTDALRLPKTGESDATTINARQDRRTNPILCDLSAASALIVVDIYRAGG